MVVEYASPQEDTQTILQPMVLTLLMQVARQYKRAVPAPDHERLSDRIIRYMNEHPGTVTLKDIAKHFSYHPNYVSGLLHRQTGKTFSELQLKQRMERAVSLLKGTTLSVEEIAAIQITAIFIKLSGSIITSLRGSISQRRNRNEI